MPLQKSIPNVTRICYAFGKPNGGAEPMSLEVGPFVVVVAFFEKFRFSMFDSNLI
jgi:hypothetical protein